MQTEEKILAIAALHDTTKNLQDALLNEDARAIQVMINATLSSIRHYQKCDLRSQIEKQKSL